MRKQTKLVAVLSAAALLAIGASMTSFAAAAHWDQEDGEWVYLDRNGDRVTDEWKKSNNQWYYLDSDGYMAREQVIEDDDDKYYVDANGVRVTNAWVSLDNDDLLDDDDAADSIDTVWMYFDGSGKAIGAGTSNGAIKRLNYGDGQSAYFIFNQDGYMLSGWQRWSKSGDSEKLYYLGGQNEGWAHTGWQWLEIDPDCEAFTGIDTEDDEYDDEAYFFFDSNGKAYENASKTISGKNYAFDEFGRMIDLWVYKDPTASDSYTNANGTSTASSAAFYQEDNGGREKNWIYAYPKTGYDNYSDDPYWFYLDKNGKPFRAGSTEGVSVGVAKRIDDDDKGVGNEDDAKYNGAVSAKSIKNQTYLFNDKGVMLTGLYQLDNEVGKGTTTMNPGIYYFTIDGNHSSVEGQMVKNKRVTLDVDGEDETYYFKSTGEAYTGVIINGYVYNNRDNDTKGQLVTEYGDGNTYAKVKISNVVEEVNGSFTIYKKDGKTPEVTTTNGDAELLINEKGKIRKSGTITDVNDEKVTVVDYIVKDAE